MKITGYIIPGGLQALNTKGGWLIVHGQPTNDFTEPVCMSGAVDMRRFISETAASPEKARAFLQDAGILDERGELAEPYRTPGVGSVEAPSTSVTVDTLRQHWLRAMECDHDTGRDKPHCSCSRVDLGWHPSIGAAVEAWLTHVAGVALVEAPSIDEGKLPPRPTGDNGPDTDPDSPLERWGRAKRDGHVLLERMADGYWTPWHIANEMLREAQRNAGVTGGGHQVKASSDVDESSPC